MGLKLKSIDFDEIVYLETSYDETLFSDRKVAIPTSTAKYIVLNKDEVQRDHSLVKFFIKVSKKYPEYFI